MTPVAPPADWSRLWEFHRLHWGLNDTRRSSHFHSKQETKWNINILKQIKYTIFLLINECSWFESWKFESEFMEVRGFSFRKSGNQKPWTVLARLHRISKQQYFYAAKKASFSDGEKGKIWDLWQSFWLNMHFMTNRKMAFSVAKSFVAKLKLVPISSMKIEMHLTCVAGRTRHRSWPQNKCITTWSIGWRTSLRSHNTPTGPTKQTLHATWRIGVPNFAE